MKWYGDAQYFLAIVQGDERTSIDLDQPGWLIEYAELLRQPGTWFLTFKDTHVAIVALEVLPGEVPYYMARHIGIASAVTGDRKAEVTAYGIGKKRLDGHVDRLWVLPDGLVCAGDDIERFALEAIKGGY